MSNGVVDVGGEHFNAQSGPNALSAPVRRERQTVLTKICTSLIQKAAQFKQHIACLGTPVRADSDSKRAERLSLKVWSS